MAKTPKTIVEELHEIKNTIKLMVAVVFISLAVMSGTTILGLRTAQNTKEIGQQNNTFLSNFSDYMRCLVVNDDQVVIAVGEETYFGLCDDLLFRGTGREHTVTKVTIPPNLTTTTSGPSGFFVDPNSTTTTTP